MSKDRIEMMFHLMEYGNLTDSQHDLVCNFEKQYEKRGRLSEKQIEILEDIFKRATEKHEWSRW